MTKEEFVDLLRKILNTDADLNFRSILGQGSSKLWQSASGTGSNRKREGLIHQELISCFRP